MMARIKKSHQFNEDVEQYITNFVYNDEYIISKNAKNVENLDFESTLDMLECKRTEKEYSWMSDFFFPHLPSIILTDASAWANQYFQTRDFVEVKLEGNTEDDQKKCKAAKKCINQSLNNRGIYHYHKYIRARTINALIGQVYALCWWEKEIIPEITGYNAPEISFDEVTGEKITGEQKPVYGQRVVVDRFNYEPVDSRNVYTDSKYCYSIQDKEFIIVRDETSYEDLKSQEQDKGYFNLHLVKELLSPQKTAEKTETSQETYDKNEPSAQPPTQRVSKLFDRLIRFGKFWVIRKENDKIVPGYNKNGESLDNAELIEVIMEIIVSGNSKILIRFQPNPYRDSKGNPYRPVIRGWCYIHPTKDIGLSDGKMNREIQIGINDCLNMAGDRVKLATLPTLKGRKYALENNPTVYFEPQHVIELDNPKEDLEEMKISDDISGILQMAAIFEHKGQTASSIYPTTMGDLPEKSSTTATAIAGAEQRGNLRANYKSLTFEYTFLLDFYWMNLQMTHQFAEEETAFKMMGDDAAYFDPDEEYTYTPVSSNIELEYNKNKKIQNYDQTLGRISGLVQNIPELVPIVAHILRRQLELQGDEYPIIAKMIEKLSGAEVQTEPGKGQDIANMRTIEGSNQNMLPVSGQEESARDMGNEQGQMGM